MFNQTCQLNWIEQTWERERERETEEEEKEEEEEEEEDEEEEEICKSLLKYD